MRRKFFLVALLAFVCEPTYAQDYFNQYVPLRSEGEVPLEIIHSATQQYLRSQSQDRQISRGSRRFERNARDKFLLNSTFVIDELLTSGKVLFNDTVSRYINRVADRLLANDPATRSKLKFMVVKSLVTNAFAYDGGFIFVNIGLVSRLNSEAELAFILAHEISHYKNHHGMERYVEGARLERASRRGVSDSISRNSLEDRLLARHAFSRTQESQADLEGLEIYLAAGYTPQAIDATFDLLLHATEMYVNLPVQSQLVSLRGLTLPDSLFYPPIELDHSAREEGDDIHSTHPNIAKRRQAVKDALAPRPPSTGALNFLPLSDFYFVRNIARFEMARMLYLYRYYPEAIYSAQCLINEFPQSKYLHSLLVESFYAYGCYASADNLASIMQLGRPDISGNFSTFFRFIAKLGKSSGTAYSMAKLYELTDNPMASEMAKKRLADLGQRANALLDNYFWQQLGDTLSLDSLIYYQLQKSPEAARYSATPSRANRRSRAATNAEKPDELPTPATVDTSIAIIDTVALYRRFAFLMAAELQGNGTITMRDTTRWVYSEENAFPFTSSWDFNYAQYQERNSSLGRRRNSSRFLSSPGLQVVRPTNGISKVSLLCPNFYFADGRRRDAVKLMDNEALTLEFQRDTRRIAKVVGLELDLITPKGIQANNVQRFNAYADYAEWIQERMSHSIYLPPSEITAGSIEGNSASRYVGVFNGQSLILPRAYKGIYIAFGIINPFFLPIAIWYVATSEHRTAYAALVFDRETGRNVAGFRHVLSIQDRNDMRNSVIYNWLKGVRDGAH